MTTSRRHFLRAAASLAAVTAPTGAARFATPLALGLAGLGTLAHHQARAAGGAGGDYRALVCLFLAGGHDGHNWIVPRDAEGHAAYSRVRGPLAVASESLLPLRGAAAQGSGRAFGMHPALAPLHALYDAGRAAVVANVGPLLQPTTRADVAAGRGLPPRLFSHNDQASTWQSMAPEGAPSGWGGRFGDLLMSANAQPVFTAITASGRAVFLDGDVVRPYRVGELGPLGVRALANPWLHGSSTGAQALRRVLAQPGTHPLQASYQALLQRSTEAEAALRSALATSPAAALPDAPFTGPDGSRYLPADDTLARQLAIVARIVGAHAATGARRQVFLVSIGGFDTHSNQRRQEATLMARVANAVRWFHDSLAAIGLADRVTLFTASEFGRTLVSNGDGSDHGWGNHHLVVGGGVRGRQIAGRFPVTALGTELDIGSGRLLPTTSVSQLAATLGGWLGLDDAQLLDVLPGLDRFPTRTLPLF